MTVSVSENRYPHRPFSKRPNVSQTHIYLHTRNFGENSIAPNGFCGKAAICLPCSPTPEWDSKSSANLCPSKSLRTILVGKFGLKSFTKNAGFLFKIREDGWFPGIGLGGDRRLNLHEAVGIVLLMKWLSFAKRPNILKCLEMTGHKSLNDETSSRFP